MLPRVLFYVLKDSSNLSCDRQCFGDSTELRLTALAVNPTQKLPNPLRIPSPRRRARFPQLELLLKAFKLLHYPATGGKTHHPLESF